MSRTPDENNGRFHYGTYLAHAVLTPAPRQPDEVSRGGIVRTPDVEVELLAELSYVECCRPWNSRFTDRAIGGPHPLTGIRRTSSRDVLRHEACVTADAPKPVGSAVTYACCREDSPTVAPGP